MQSNTGALLSAAALAANMLAVSATAHEAVPESTVAGYQMAAVIDRAHGNVVLSGDYGKAIEDLGSRNRRHFESSTNLCVAYTMSGDLERADIECAAALELSEKSAVRRDIAVALSNRGVVKAVSGDLNGARRDFSRALEINADLRQASDNLQILRESDASDA
jgi:tetratricopeptide (TPR) repeat protein